MQKNAKGARFTVIHALCGSGAMDKLHKNPEFYKSFLAQQEANELREGYFGKATKFADVHWEEYQGTDSNHPEASDLELGEDEIIFFPGGDKNNIYREVLSPGEKFSDLGKLGEKLYSWLQWGDDKDDPEWVKIFVAKYVLYLNTRPEMTRIGNAQWNPA